MIGNYPR